MKAVTAQVVSCCVNVKPPKIIQYIYGHIPYHFDFWADPFVHLIILKISMGCLSLNTLFEEAILKRKSKNCKVQSRDARFPLSATGEEEILWKPLKIP